MAKWGPRGKAFRRRSAVPHDALPAVPEYALTVHPEDPRDLAL